MSLFRQKMKNEGTRKKDPISFGLISLLIAANFLSSCQSARPFADQVLDIEQISLQPAPSRHTRLVSLSFRESAAPWLSYTDSNDVMQIALDRKGVIWAGGPGGVSRWDPAAQKYQVFTISDGLPENYITALAVSPDDQVWVGTLHGQMAKYDGSTWTNFDPKIAEMISCLAVASNGTIWIGTNKGLAHFDGRNNWYVYPPQKIPDNYIHSLAVTSSGSVWAGVMGGALYYDGNNWNSKRLEKGERVSGIVEGPDGTIWLVADMDLIHFDGTRWTEYKLKDGFSGISALAVDRQGRVWLADKRSSLARFDAVGRQLFKYPIHGVTSLALDGAGDLWFSRLQGGIGHFQPYKNVVDNIVAENQPTGNFVLSSAVASDGSIWVGTDQGVSRFDGTRWQSYTTADGLLDDTVLAIASAPDGSMWFGTVNGVSIFDGLSWKNDPQNGLVDPRVDNLTVSRDGTIWTINHQSLFQRIGGQWELAQSPFSAPDESLKAIEAGSGTGLWLLSLNGLWYFDNQKWISFVLPSGAIPMRVLQTGDQDFWIFAQGLGLLDLHGPLWDQVVLEKIQSVILKDDGHVEARTGSEENTLLNGVAWRVYPLEEDLSSSDQIYLISPGMGDKVWLIGDQKILTLENGNWVEQASPLNHNDYGFNTALMDPQGSLWLSAPLLEGILKYSP